jgi:hypothetical protein
MKRTATILLVALPFLLYAGFTAFCAIQGHRNGGWHVLPFEAIKTLVGLSNGRDWHALDILAAIVFYGSGIIILTAYILGSLIALKKKSYPIAFGSSAAFIILIEGWALIITIPSLVVPTG